MKYTVYVYREHSAEWCYSVDINSFCEAADTAHEWAREWQHAYLVVLKVNATGTLLMIDEDGYIGAARLVS